MRWLDCFDFACAATNITSTFADSLAFLTVADWNASNRPFAVAAAITAAGHPLAMAFRT
jgi:hypothetical protein